jgi:hypothetical protein
MDKVEVKYYGLERDFTGKNEEWTPVGIVGTADGTPYGEIRTALDILENFRIRPIENYSLWEDVFKSGCIIEYKVLCIAIRILCTK